jgi:uncharacterized tellurite resistance protein B-like protein
MYEYDYNSYENSIVILLYAIDADNQRKDEELKKLECLESRIKNFCTSKSLEFTKIVKDFDEIKKKHTIDQFLNKIDDNFLRLEIVTAIYKIFYSDSEYHKQEHVFINYISKFWNLK